MGTITVFGQLTTFALSLALGIAYSLLYDIFRLLHFKYLKGRWSVFVSDILYWLILLVLTYSFLLLFCNGSIRAYVLFGNLMGFAVCRLTLSKVFIKLCLLVAFLLEKLLHYILLPLKKLFKVTFKLFSSLFSIIKITAQKIFKKKKKSLERDNANGV